ncbi:hypothetical protein MtrunA17_Chr3g0137461 [Medicago truncatula]|uniref:Uncharacterized protein n=1 Tax=Medicago truncatula TaxID=3880 RepID=A0A396J1P0_MEDTR|nr:hypothetical protein MtrunA17_Chr3g0137461 [Medicago truncatula]
MACPFGVYHKWLLQFKWDTGCYRLLGLQFSINYNIILHDSPCCSISNCKQPVLLKPVEFISSFTQIYWMTVIYYNTYIVDTVGQL